MCNHYTLLQVQKLKGKMVLQDTKQTNEIKITVYPLLNLNLICFELSISVAHSLTSSGFVVCQIE